MAYLPLISILLIIAEIRVFLWVAATLGLGTAILLCIISAVIGGAVVRRQGLAALLRLQEGMMHKDVPMRAFFDAGCLAVAGVLMIIPGFITDVIGLALMTPSVRNQLFGLWQGHGSEAGSAARARRKAGIIDGEFVRLDDRDGRA